jgi:hypothetical protein
MCVQLPVHRLPQLPCRRQQIGNGTHVCPLGQTNKRMPNDDERHGDAVTAWTPLPRMLRSVVGGTG